MVHGPGRRLDRLCGEPAQEVPGHLSPELRQRPGGHLRRDPGGRAHLDQPRRDDLPRRQPAHQAADVLAAPDPRGPLHQPRGALPGRGLHPPGHDAHPGQDRLPPVIHLLRVAQHQAGAHRLPGRALPRDSPRAAPGVLADHPRHPHPLHDQREGGGLQAARGPGGHHVPDLGHLLGLRAGRVDPAPGLRGAAQQREVRVQAARLRRRARQRHRGPAHAPERHSRRAPRPAPAARRLVPRHERRHPHRLLQAGRRRALPHGQGRHRADRGQPGSAQHPRGRGLPQPAAAGAAHGHRRLAALPAGDRRAHR